MAKQPRTFRYEGRGLASPFSNCGKQLAASGIATRIGLMDRWVFGHAQPTVFIVLANEITRANMSRVSLEWRTAIITRPAYQENWTTSRKLDVHYFQPPSQDCLSTTILHPKYFSRGRKQKEKNKKFVGINIKLWKISGI